jgi:hypothetical protein
MPSVRPLDPAALSPVPGMLGDVPPRLLDDSAGATEGRMTQVLGYGGGVQTVAMCLLVAKGVLPKPDRIVCADTSREVQSTWDYLGEYVGPFMERQCGLTVETAPHSLATVDLFDSASAGPLMPMWTPSGMMRTFCSVEWKQRVAERYLRSTGVKGATTWIGFSLDEKKMRVKGNGRSPWFRAYPLIDLMLTRSDCEAIIVKQGWPVPSKSACYCCPHRINAEWREVRDKHPEQFAKAIEVEQDIQLNDTRGGALFLHSSRVPLAEADLDAPDRRFAPRQCGLGTCWV